MSTPMSRPMYRTAVIDLPDGDDFVEVGGCVFPFGVVKRVADPLPDGTVDVYDEEFAPRCTWRMSEFARQRGNWWITYTVDHDQTFEGKIGRCTGFRESGDGAYATFELYKDPARLPKIRDMLRTSHRGFSIEFRDIGPSLVGDYRKHTQIHVDRVTATGIPAYPQAGIMAMREDGDSADGFTTPRLDAVRAMIAGWKDPVTISDPSATVPA